MPVKQVIECRVPIKIWTDDVEAEAVEQLKKTAALPFVFKHLAVMPDVHAGKGATVGSVMATTGAVCPAAVGVDIGCGMAATKLNVPINAFERLPELRHSIERSIPVGFNFNKSVGADVDAWEGWQAWLQLHPKCQGLGKRAREQMSSLGGGNHFIELCQDTEGGAWVVLHSGSRNIGKSLAEAHIDTAKDLMRRMFIDLPDPDLAYFAQGTDDFKAYIRDLTWAQGYAAKNREIMMARILKDTRHHLGREIAPEPTINCHHNFAVMEAHFGKNVLVTRKGAVRARQGDMGIIPGSMGTRSYIVRGLGNPESFDSCSHGAGRRMSRTKARHTFTEADLVAQTAGVECRKDKEVIDEIPGAYKPIEEVMANQSDLVEIVAELKQVLCVKG
jgi:tRNA-splicing ligase RtcB (3'-phosphate/5'-hydroxy nucleic acid ligase)